MRALEKRTVSENLHASKTGTQKEQGDLERGSAFPIFDRPPRGQVWTSRQCRSLQDEKHKEKAEVAPDQTRKLGLDGRTGEHVGREVFSASGSGTGKCEEHHGDRIGDRRCRLQPIGPVHQEDKKQRAAKCHAEEQRRHQEEA